MSDIAIKVERLSKKYIIGHQKSDSIKDSIKNGIGHFFKGQKQELEEFWALIDINFEIKKGEAVGIIGKNGAGKSTLLKILSRITHPTEGRFEMNGRVSSLLEVGTGFHPELSGRENIYLNGTILGMTRSEIKSKFDEIVDFSGVEKFIDTPVKHYSSGMYVRLAFAVAAHLEPEILIIDEVLAVGDAEFQKKCLGKMNEVTKSGRSVIFVSHNIGAVLNLCTKGILIEEGNIMLSSPIEEVVQKYIGESKQIPSNFLDSTLRTGNGKVQLKKFWIEANDHSVVDKLLTGNSYKFKFELFSRVAVEKLDLGFSIHNSIGESISVLYSSFQNHTFNTNGKDDLMVECQLEALNLTPGNYMIKCRILENGNEADWPQFNIGNIKIEMGNFYPSTIISNWGSKILLNGKWTSE